MASDLVMRRLIRVPLVAMSLVGAACGDPDEAVTDATIDATLDAEVAADAATDAAPGPMWTAPQRLPMDTATSAYWPKVVLDAAGDATVIWYGADGTSTSMWATRIPAVGGASTTTMLEAIDAGESLLPAAAIDGSGNVVAVWQKEDDPSGISIWAARYTPGAGWSAATRLEAAGGTSYAAHVAADPAGNAIAVWQRNTGARRDIWASRYAAGAGWGTATLVENDDAGDAFVPQVAMDPAGNATVVWQQSDGTRRNLWSNRFVAGTGPGAGWGTATLIETDDASEALWPHVAVDDAGNAIAVWEQTADGHASVWSSRFVPGAGWGTPALVEHDSTGAAGAAQLGFDAAGNAVAVFVQRDAVRPSIHASRHVPGTGWSTPVPVDAADTDTASPVVAVDDAGRATALWIQNDGGRSNVWSSRYAPATGWSPPALVEHDSTYNAGLPQLATNASGDVIAAWMGQLGVPSPHGIWTSTLAD